MYTYPPSWCEFGGLLELLQEPRAHRLIVMFFTALKKEVRLVFVNVSAMLSLL